MSILRSGLRAAALLLALCAFQQAAGELEIERAERTIGLKSQRALHRTQLTLKNSGRSPEAAVTLCLPDVLRHNAAVLAVAQATPSGAPAHLKPTNDGWAAPPGAPSPPSLPFSCASFSLPDPLAPGATATIAIESVITNIVHPKPAQIKQDETQRMEYSDAAHVISPYRIASDVTEIDFGAPTAESFDAPAPAAMVDERLKLGPYSSLAAFAGAQEGKALRVHYENDYPMVEARSVVREISISHWGHVFVEEDYDIAHNGARIAGEWSRLDTLLKPETMRGAAGQLPAYIPESAQWIYFRDELGNISSSRVGLAPGSGMVAMLSPRYPLVGGWSTKFTFGYAIPLPGAVGRDGESGRFALVTAALPSVRDIVIERLEVRVVLPEFATDPRIEAHFEYEEGEDRKVTYFDLRGRRVVVLRLKNVVPEMGANFVISYSYAPIMMFVKPLTVSAALAVIIVAIVMMGGGGGGGKEGAGSQTAGAVGKKMN